MKTLLLVLALAFVATGCVMDEDDPPPVDAPEQLFVFDCGIGSDTSIDTPADPCAACGQGMMCVQLLDGTCGSLSVTCVPAVSGCEQATCSPACDNAYCDRQISTCSAAPCAADIPGAFHCYGV
jgi:hypothetical protein